MGPCARGIALFAIVLLRGSIAVADDQPELLERAIEHDLDTIESGVLAPPGSSADLFRPGRELRITGRRLDTLKTWTPQDESIPVLERHLDRLERPLPTKRPPPVDRDPLPPRRSIVDFGRP